MFLVVPVATAAVLLGSAFIFDGAGARWIFAGVPLALVTAFGLVHGFTLPEDYLKRWTKSHGVAITAENERIIRHYLLRGRRFRTVGALAGYIAYSIYHAVTIDRLPFGWITSTFAGYLLGAAAAEVWAARPERGTVRIASLSPRRVTAYLPRTAVVLMRAVPVATIVLAVCWPIIPVRPELADLPNLGRPNPIPIIAWTAASAALWVLVELTSRRIVNRPQPVESEEFIVVDDAIRSTALHGMVGAGLALMLGALSRALGDWTGLVGPGRLDGFFGGVMIVAAVGSILAWLRLGIDQDWIVRRVPSREKVPAA